MRTLDVLARARDLVASGAASTVVEALRLATPSPRERLDAWRAYLEARLSPDEPPVSALDAAITLAASDPAPQHTCAYCGRELGDYVVTADRRVYAPFCVVPGVRSGLAVCDECAAQAVRDSFEIHCARQPQA